MRKRHNRLGSGHQWAAGHAAAVLFCLSGTVTGLAQSGTTAPGIRNPMAQQGGSSGTEKVKVDEHLIVDLHVNDEDLANVLQMLSIQSQKNIVASRNVSAIVTANLYGVTFYEALDAILHVNGYGYVERGNFIYVYTLDELQQIEAAQRTRAWRVVRLNYLNSVDAAEFVRPLLSDQGQIKTNGRAPTFSEGGILTAEEFAAESSMLIFDFEENLDEIERVVRELDTRPAQVLIEATILQTALTEANAFGVDFALLGDMNFADFIPLGGPLQAVDAMVDGVQPVDSRGSAMVSTVGNTGGPATFKMGIVRNDVSAFLRLLDEVSDTTILSRPNLLILNRAVGHVLVGRKVGYLSTTSTDTATTQSVQFLDTGTQLVVRPFISADGMIRMELKPKVSEAVIRNATTVGGQAVTIPDEISNELTTTVLVRDGQTIVLGGLFRESTQASRRQIPFAGDIPFIGAAFRGHEDEVQRSEVIFMITPTIMADNVLLEQGQRAEAAVEQVRAGSRQGLLPWSRDKRTQQMLVQAVELAQRGEHQRALYRVNRALRLNPFQPDAIALREQLRQEPTVWPTRSIQHEILSGEIERLLEDQYIMKPMPKPETMLTVEVEAGDGIVWFDDEDGFGGETFMEVPSAETEPEPAEMEQVMVEEQVSSAAPAARENAPEAKTPAQDEAATAAAPEQLTASQRRSQRLAAARSAHAAAAIAPSAPAAEADVPSEEPSEPVAIAEAPAKESAPEPVKVETEPLDVAASEPSHDGGMIWSSALAAALEESGTMAEFEDLFADGDQAQGEAHADAEWAGGDEMFWDPAWNLDAPNNGIAGIFADFSNIWSLFQSYTERSVNPGKESAVTSVPNGRRE